MFSFDRDQETQLVMLMEFNDKCWTTVKSQCGKSSFIMQITLKIMEETPKGKTKREMHF